ncbi:hypothetical protein CYMTET_28450 [Cymbomonas tetramitiformis]|uniref:Acetyl-CoA C-acetyltransferase n=1 Tax=Cymbomonas tetramitiformis TaxID=36881 RepID=A0AAE0FMT5_9CHLO|nr:hypothetical protein CYMTET_28450 [Cymbomonas tetramitiformis]
MEEVVIVAARRTAVGNFNGTLSGIPASTLGATVIKQLLADAKLDPEKVDEVILGQVLTTATGQNPARQAALEAGLPFTCPALTINKVCGSGLKALDLGAQAIKCGDAKVVIAGGQESMSLAPHALPKSRVGQKMGDWKLVDTMIQDGLWCAFNKYHMGVTAENVAAEYGVAREAQDEFAAASQAKATAAQQAGKFKQQIVPVAIPQRKGAAVMFDQDEYIKANTTLKSLQGLKPAFKKGGSVTAGNASGLNDGAAAVMLMAASTAAQLNLTPLAVIRSFASAGVDPKIMGTGPIPASQKALAKAGWSIAELDLVEANEAFAAQACAVNKGLGWDASVLQLQPIPKDPPVNVNGGAIAIGHPIGASGCRVLVDLVHEMARRGARKGLATLCIGGGQGVALCVEHFPQGPIQAKL